MSGFPEYLGLKWDQFNKGTLGAFDVVLLVLEALEGHWVLKEFVGFEEVQDPAEPGDHELLRLLGLEDILQLPLFFYFRCVLSFINYLVYIFFCVFPYLIVIIDIILAFCSNSNCLKMYISESPLLVLSSWMGPHVM